MLPFSAELVDPPVWKKYTAQYADSSGNAKTGELEQPFFHTRRVTTYVRVKNGATVLAGAGMNDEKNETVTFLLVTVRLLNSQEQPLGQPVEQPDPTPLK